MGQGHNRYETSDVEAGGGGIETDVTGYRAAVDMIPQFLLMRFRLDETPLFQYIYDISHLLVTFRPQAVLSNARWSRKLICWHIPRHAFRE
jgi:hypothetical protein